MIKLDTPEAVAAWLGLDPAKPVPPVPAAADEAAPFADDGPAVFPDDVQPTPIPRPKTRKRKPR